MTPTEFKMARITLGLTQTQTAEIFGRKLRQVQNWESVGPDDLASSYMRALIRFGLPDTWDATIC